MSDRRCDSCKRIVILYDSASHEPEHSRPRPVVQVPGKHFQCSNCMAIEWHYVVRKRHTESLERKNTMRWGQLH